jgi:hypothetical protein
MKNQFPSLRNFLGGYFNQDWDLDYESEEAVLKAFVAAVQRRDVVTLVSEIQKVVSLPMNDDDLKRFVQQELACDYEPQGMSMRQWLSNEVGGYLTRHLNQTAS